MEFFVWTRFSILMQIEGNLAQAEDAIMLDKDGFVSETNATNIVSIHTFIKTTSRHLIHDCSKTALCQCQLQFMVKKGIVLTPHADYCLPGITRATVSIIRFQLEQLGPIYTSAS